MRGRGQAQGSATLPWRIASGKAARPFRSHRISARRVPAGTWLKGGDTCAGSMAITERATHRPQRVSRKPVDPLALIY
jgi:hypothetical protein